MRHLNGTVGFKSGKLEIAMIMAAVVLCFSCAEVTEDPMEAGEQLTRITEKDALEIAKKEYFSAGGLGRFTAKVNKNLNNDGYEVTIEKQPRTPGGHCTIYISRNGMVTEVLPGN